ncbi:RDD family protein [Roseiconus nitratireducens]|uniref:RDD family protein n=1 Tax=Roseiconus nitratireducens TaxID=2605748 RepID=A0A5M6DBK6_9BACT|nr:RDD family protein [Roseiconus nitratireducens]KAA5543702.1 RDD family protein [Roseiconus nitratireducens]
MAAAQPLDTTIGVVTPENIAFEYQLAGPFRRLPAYLIDLAVRWGVILLIGAIILMIAGTLSFLSTFYGPLAQAFILVAIFLINWFYGTICEAYFNGRTIGKWMCGIRVIEVDGRPVSPRSALLRNLLRIADMAPVAAINTWDPDVPPIYLIPTGIIGLVSMMMTERMQRLGDLAAGTMVVVDERKWQLPIAKVDDARVAALASYVPGDYRVSRKMARTLATYVERRHFLTPQRRREVARHLTDPLIERFEFRHDIDPDLLMYALYYRTFLTDSSAEPADLGPLAGYSPLAKDANKPGGLADAGVNDASEAFGEQPASQATPTSDILSESRPGTENRSPLSSSAAAVVEPAAAPNVAPNVDGGSGG